MILFISFDKKSEMIDHCPKCGSTERVKNGHAKGRPRFRCKACGYDYTVMQKSTAVSTSQKRLALQLYLEGLGFNSIGRVIGVSHVAVLKWIREYGKQAEELRSENEITVLEMDEMHSYIGSKKTISGFGLLLIDMEKDSSTAHWVPGELSQVRNSGNQ